MKPPRCMLTRSGVERKYASSVQGAARARHSMRVGIFGGSFNPPHIAHLLVAELVREEFELDEVIWIVSARPPHKDVHSLASAADRLTMVRLAIEGNRFFKWSDVEVQREGPSYTIESLRYFRAQRPHAAHFLIMGGDSLAEFGTWRDPKSILSEAQLIVFNRTGTPPPEQPAASDRVHFSTSPCIDVSSSSIRHRIRRGRSIRYLVPSSVRDYIAENGLYGQTRVRLSQ